MDILCCQLCALVPGTQRLVLWLERAQHIYEIRFSGSGYFPWQGFPLNILLDSASGRRSDEISGLASGCEIELQFSTVEAHWSLGSGERVHSLIRNVYLKVHMKAPYLTLETKLSWSVFALNATPPRDGTAASLLVFGTLPRLPVSGLNQTALQRNDCR
jgi:hypothetical protein